jgi:hypothetical protein
MSTLAYFELPDIHSLSIYFKFLVMSHPLNFHQQPPKLFISNRHNNSFFPQKDTIIQTFYLDEMILTALH